MEKYIKEMISIKDYSYYRIGGIVRYFAQPSNLQELLFSINLAKGKGLPYFIFGSSSNILFSDDMFDGMLISMALFESRIKHDRGFIYAGAGTLLDDLVKYSIRLGYDLFPELSGIPGTVGGAAHMNAGAFGVEVKDLFDNITIMGKDGKISVLDSSEVGFGYRSAKNISDKIILSVTIKRILLNKLSADDLKFKRESILNERWAKQPLEQPSCGSVFKRPKGNFAGTLIEKNGLKGYRIGNAEVSNKHGNFILNLGGAKASDVKSIIAHIKDTVLKTDGVILETEVIIFDDIKNNL